MKAMGGPTPRSGNRFLSGLDADGHLHFDQSVLGKSIHADGGADVASGFTEDVDEQVGGAVDDRGSFLEAGGGVDITIERDHFGDALERTQLMLENGELNEGAGAGSGVAFFDSAIDPGEAGDEALRSDGGHTGEIQDFADLLGGDIVAAARRQFGKGESEGGELLFRCRCLIHLR